MDPTLKAALASPAPTMFGAVRIAFPDYTLRLVDGAGHVIIGSEAYLGRDPTFGVLDTISSIEEELGDEAPEITIGLQPPDAAAASTLVHSSMQGSEVRLMLGVLDPASGMTIGVPETIFLGEIDVPSLDVSQGERSVSYTVTSVFERLFEVDEGQRASDGWHQSIWPGELGLAHMTGTDVNLYWGAKPPSGRNLIKIPFLNISVPAGAK